MGCAKILTTDFAITPELPEPASLNASRLADYRVGLAGPASPRESVNKISVCGGLGGHGNRGFEYISLGWICQPASRNQTSNICRARGLSLYRDFPVRRVPEQVAHARLRSICH